MASARERSKDGYVQTESDAAALTAAEAKRERRAAKRAEERGWLRRAQERIAEKGDAL